MAAIQYKSAVQEAIAKTGHARVDDLMESFRRIREARPIPPAPPKVSMSDRIMQRYGFRYLAAD